MEEQLIVELMAALKYALRQYNHERNKSTSDSNEGEIHWKEILLKLRPIIERKIEQIVEDKKE